MASTVAVGRQVPYALELADGEGSSLGEIVLANERAWSDDVDTRLDHILSEFEACIARGLAAEGELPGGLGVHRRAGTMMRRVDADEIPAEYASIARAQAYAYAINEENADGGRVVTAPPSQPKGRREIYQEEFQNQHAGHVTAICSCRR